MASGDRLSIHATGNDLGFQELAATTTPVRTDVEARISVNAAAIATMLVTRLRTTNDDDASIQMFVLEIIIAVLHRLPNGWRVGLCRVCIGLTLLDVGYSVRSGVNAHLLL